MRPRRRRHAPIEVEHIAHGAQLTQRLLPLPRLSLTGGRQAKTAPSCADGLVEVDHKASVLLAAGAWKLLFSCYTASDRPISWHGSIKLLMAGSGMLLSGVGLWVGGMCQLTSLC